MIIIRLIGGLGNQMFQYAFGKALAVKNNSVLKLDITHLTSRYKSKSIIFRNFDLDIFKNLDLKVADKKEISEFTLPKGNYNYTIYKLLNKIHGEKRVFAENGFEFNPQILSVGDNCYLRGLWQSYKYFENIKDVIKSGFLIDEMIPESKEIFEKIGNTNSVCISYRRKEYLADKYLSTLKEDYFDYFYGNAVKMICSKIEKPVFFIFSDDIDWCRKNVKIEGEHYFVGDEHSGFKFGNKFKLMYSCRHFIIPNSTYPWWAAWIGERSDSIIIAPKKWFTIDINTDGLIPEGWVRI